jgi:hypothetical protein
MNMQTRTSRLTIPLAVLLLTATSLIEAGDKSRTILPGLNAIAGTTVAPGIRHAGLEAAGLEPGLNARGQFALFAPTDQGFAELPGWPGLVAVLKYQLPP